jgi:hypothetical protein
MKRLFKDSPDRTLRSSFVLKLTFAAVALGGVSQAHAVCYVNAAATGHNNGTSWADASTQLSFSLIDPLCTEIWVAKGVYKPTLGSDRTISFDIPPGTQLYGGFEGNEFARDARDPKTNVTVLSGDIDNNDTNAGGSEIDATTTDIVGNNSYHVLTMYGTLGVGIDSSTILDGFTITGGNAIGTAISDFFIGGGLFCDGSGSGNSCSPTLRQLVFVGNRATEGGALANSGVGGGTSNPTLIDVEFFGNLADPVGGAMFNTHSSPVLTNVSFAGNSATNGGAMCNIGYKGASNPTLVNVTFTGNSASLGGGMFNYGENGGDSSPLLTNVTFADNTAVVAGGGMYNSGADSGNSSPVLSNVILWNEVAPSGAEIYNNSAAPDIDHSIVKNGCPSGSVCSNLQSTDPQLSKLGDFGGFTATLRPNIDGPAIDSGDDATCPVADQRGVGRPQGAHCDIGAVELLPLEDVIFKDGLESL